MNLLYESLNALVAMLCMIDEWRSNNISMAMEWTYIFPVFTLGLYLRMHSASLSVNQSVSQLIHALFVNSLQASFFVVAVPFLRCIFAGVEGRM